MTETIHKWQEDQINEALSLKTQKITGGGVEITAPVTDSLVWSTVRRVFEPQEDKLVSTDDHLRKFTTHRYETKYPDTYIDVTTDNKTKEIVARVLVRMGEGLNRLFRQTHGLK